MAHCNQCDLDWEPRVADPSCCPRCKRYDWAEHKKSPGRVSRKSNGARSSVVELPLHGASKVRGDVAGSIPARSTEPTVAVDPVEEAMSLCRSCEEPLVASGGKLYCANQACSDRGIEQKVRRMK